MEKEQPKEIFLPTLEQVERERNKLKYQKEYRRTILHIIGILIVAAAVSVLLATMFFPIIQVSGVSMEPTLEDEQIILLEKTGKFKTGDLIGFYYQNKILLKRVIGRAGDYIDIFKVIGLDAGTYYLKETKAPEGYNSLKDSIQLTITATTANDQEWNGTASNALTELNLTVGGTISNGNITTGIVSTTVENNKGSILPSTGGIGTTIFYVIGGILMVGAGVILVSRRRRSK